ncbi:hypothetical protein OQA88_5916 [Cercophora sp. LCS_1]
MEDLTPTARKRLPANAGNPPPPTPPLGPSESRSNHNAPPRSRTSGDFAYQPLDPNNDSIRLISIRPTKFWSTIVECSVHNIGFVELPQYRALSYTWGDGIRRRNIHLNGSVFPVNGNLFDALWFFSRRDQFRGGFFWIDALCINQQDIDEKNRQLPMMPHIYFRAEAVLAWLGDIESYRPFEKNPRPVNSQRRRKYSYQERCDLFIRSNDYWDRLWIIQEIGKAAQILVLYKWSTGFIYTWDEFISYVEKKHKGLTGGPIALDVQLRGKYNGKHSLRHLLQAHERAKCQRPHDKVYGLLGLAEDSHGFAADYRKSVFEVWKDTVTFLKPDEGDVVSLARLCARILHPIYTQRTVQELAAGLALPASQEPASPFLPLPLEILGEIGLRGPSLQCLFNSLAAAESWALSIRESDKTGTVMREHDELVHLLLRGESSSKTAAVTRFSTAFGQFEPKGTNQPTTFIELPLLPRRGPPRQTEGHDPEFFQMASSHLGWQLGLAPKDALPGDTICRIPDTRTYLLVRCQEMDGRWSILGTVKPSFDIISIPRPGMEVKSMTLLVRLETLFILTSDPENISSMMGTPAWSEFVR